MRGTKDAAVPSSWHTSLPRAIWGRQPCGQCCRFVTQLVSGTLCWEFDEPLLPSSPQAIRRTVLFSLQHRMPEWRRTSELRPSRLTTAAGCDEHRTPQFSPLARVTAVASVCPPFATTSRTVQLILRRIRLLSLSSPRGTIVCVGKRHHRVPISRREERGQAQPHQSDLQAVLAPSSRSANRTRVPGP